jgi:hypothetical protein
LKEIVDLKELISWSSSITFFFGFPIVNILN